MEIKRPRPALRARPTSKDREALDFGRYLARPHKGQPTPGFSYEKLLQIATQVCKTPITDLSQVVSKAHIRKIKNNMRRVYYAT